MTSDYHFRMSRIDVSRIPDTKTQFCLKRLNGNDPDHSITTVFRIDKISHYQLPDEEIEHGEGYDKDIGIHNVKIIGTGFQFGKRDEYPVELIFSEVNDYELWEILHVCKVGMPVKVTGGFLLDMKSEPVRMTILNPAVYELDEEKVSFYKWVSERD